MKTESFYRHGDLRIDRVESMPSGELKKEPIALALGEVTGHKHLLKTRPSGVEIANHNGATYFRVTEVTPLVHEEHTVTEFVPGIYRMTFEVDYNPLKRSLSVAKD